MQDVSRGDGPRASPTQPFPLGEAEEASAIWNDSSQPEKLGATGSQASHFTVHRPSASMAPESLKEGDRLHEYQIIRQLGRGGMGSVFLARDLTLGRMVAIKLLAESNAELGQLFIREARATARCIHENIVVLYAASECNGLPYLVLEYVHGRTLGVVLGDPLNGPALTPTATIELIVPVVRALVCAHARGVTHRDLKPGNIMVADDGVVKVLDFGIAKICQEQMQQNSIGIPLRTPFKSLSNSAMADLSCGALKGTMLYMSPEQWRSDSVDGKSDIWAVGIMLFRMLSGVHPLRHLRGMQIAVVGDLDEPMPSLTSVSEKVPVELAVLVDRCLRKRKAERPGAAELLGLLERYARQAKSVQLRRTLLFGSLAGLCLVVAGLVTGLVVIRGAQKEAQAQARIARVAEDSARISEDVARKAEAVARRAEAEAKDRLEELRQKERERVNAERLAAEQKARAEDAQKERHRAERLAKRRAAEMAHVASERTRLRAQALEAAQRRDQQVGAKPGALEDLK